MIVAKIVICIKDISFRVEYTINGITHVINVADRSGQGGRNPRGGSRGAAEGRQRPRREAHFVSVNHHRGGPHRRVRNPFPEESGGENQ